MYYIQSIEGSRNVGNKHNEGIQLGNLGDLYFTMGHWKEAEEHLVLACEICRSVLPPAAGSFSGSLAWLYAQQDKFDQAMSLLIEGEPLVEVYPEEHGKFLCKKAKVFHRMGRSKLAKEALDQAKGIGKGHQ